MNSEPSEQSNPSPSGPEADPNDVPTTVSAFSIIPDTSSVPVEGAMVTEGANSGALPGGSVPRRIHSLRELADFREVVSGKGGQFETAVPPELKASVSLLRHRSDPKSLAILSTAEAAASDEMQRLRARIERSKEAFRIDGVFLGDAALLRSLQLYGRHGLKAVASNTDLGQYTVLVSGSKQKFELAPGLRREMAVLQRNNSKHGFAIIGTQRRVRDNTYAMLKERIEETAGPHGRCRVEATFAADAGLIQSIYSAQSPERLNAELEQEETKTAREIDALVQEAMKLGVSDIHIEIRAEYGIVRFRRNGKATDQKKPIRQWSVDVAKTYARAMHAMADDDSKEPTFSENESQQMSISRTINGQKVKLRVQTSPAYPDGGMDIVLRVLMVGATAKIKPLSALGYAKQHQKMLEEMNSTPAGVIVVAGTTGSGKSTTLMTMITNAILDDPGAKFITIEDPPEYVIAGATQIPVRRKKGENTNPFLRAMRDAMRMDPDTIMVGEVRDVDSGGLLVSMTQSGHKVMTTVHADGVFGVYPRFAKMNIELETMGTRGFMAGIIYQKLMPLLCQHCRVPYKPGGHSEEEDNGIHARIAEVTKSTDTLFIEGPGCEKCDRQGISGRTVCAEMMIPDGKINKLVTAGKINDAFEYWRSLYKAKKDDDENMVGRTVLEHAILKMRAGLVSPFDVEGHCGRLTGYSWDDEN